MNRRTGFLAVLATILLLFLTLSAFAQDRDDDQDPPGRAGRVSYTSGSVSFQPGGEGDWLDAVPNRPLATGDNLWADRNSRAEVQIGSTSIRLGSETSVTLSDLDSNVTQLRLSMGTLFFRVRQVGSDDTFEVDTPNLAFNVSQPGEYRIDVNQNGDQTTAVVWHGSAEVTGGGSSYRLIDGQQGTFSGADQLRYDVGEIGGDDDFSRWCLDRDRRTDRIRSAQYVSPEVTGYEDLDEYGRWHYEATYGYVWTPASVPYGWAPYQYGHWVYISPWGWTWVEDEPWGFAPFHYGRWAYLGGGWCWVPGPVAVRPVYSPALVAFVGGGGFHVGLAVGGGVGWFPLAPGEVYVPWYRTSQRYVQNVNITNTRVTNIQVTNVYNNVTVNKVTNVTYINQRQGRGITVVNQQTFVNARPVHDNVIRVDAREIQRAPVTGGVVNDIQPQRQSVFGAAKPVRYAPPQQVMNRPVVGTRQPVMINRVAPVQGMSRPAALPPIRTVQAAPRDQAKPLERGARGTTPGFGNPPAQADRPQGPNNGSANATNRGAIPPMNGVNRGGNPNVDRGNNSDVNRPNVPRPGAQQGAGSQGEIHQNGRGVWVGNGNNSHGEQNSPANHADMPDNARDNSAPVSRPNAPDMNHPPADNNRQNTPDNNRQMPNVPRPGAPDPSEGQSDNRQNRPDQPQPRPQQPSVNSPGDQPRSNPPNARPQPPDTGNRNLPEPARPNYRNAPDNMRQDSTPAQTREQAPPPQREVRPQPAPREDNRPEPQARHESSPPPQRESRQPESHKEKGGQAADHGRDQDKPK
jgi:hypothetical protein